MAIVSHGNHLFSSDPFHEQSVLTISIVLAGINHGTCQDCPYK